MAAWRKSSHSMSSGQCVEAAGAFRRSSHCHQEACAVAGAAGGVMVRDSKNPGPVLIFTRAQWRAFTMALKVNHGDSG